MTSSTHRVPRVRVDRRQKGNFRNRVPFIFFPPRATRCLRVKNYVPRVHACTYTRARGLSQWHIGVSPRNTISRVLTPANGVHTHTHIHAYIHTSRTTNEILPTFALLRFERNISNLSASRIRFVHRSQPPGSGDEICLSWLVAGKEEERRRWNGCSLRLESLLSYCYYRFSSLLTWQMTSVASLIRQLLVGADFLGEETFRRSNEMYVRLGVSLAFRPTSKRKIFQTRDLAKRDSNPWQISEVLYCNASVVYRVVLYFLTVMFRTFVGNFCRLHTDFDSIRYFLAARIPVSSATRWNAHPFHFDRHTVFSFRCFCCLISRTASRSVSFIDTTMKRETNCSFVVAFKSNDIRCSIGHFAIVDSLTNGYGAYRWKKRRSSRSLPRTRWKWRD